MKKKVLFTATVDSHILHFHIPYLKLFKEKGYEVHVATNGNEEIPYCDKKHVISFERSPLKLNNLKAIGQLRKIINEEKFDIIHCHTPMGSVVTRLAAKKARKKGTRVIYTAHGFHFYKGAPKLNWFLFYPVEKYLSKYTDTLITINKEDYDLAKRKFKKCNDIKYVPGVGIDEKKFDFRMSKKERDDLRKSLGLKSDDFVMIYPAELSNRKRQVWLINSLKNLLKNNSNIHLLLPGKDSLEEECDKLIKELSLEKQVHILGYRKDIPKLLMISDISVSSAKQEGLPVNIMEAMYLGLPIVASDCRGNRDLVKNNKNGYIIDLNDNESFSKRIEELYKNKEKYKTFKECSKKEVKQYMLENILESMKKIYFRKKIVLHLLASNKFSGAENVACTIIDNMKNEYEFLYCSPKGPIVDSLNDKKIKYIEIRNMSINNLDKILKLYKPDIVHCHDFKASILTSFSRYKGKIISHIHKNDPKLKEISIKSILYLVSSVRYSKIVGVSSSIFNEYIFKKLISKKYVTLENYVEKENIIKNSNAFKIDKHYDLFFVGRLSTEKNPLMFIDIVKRINERKKIKAVIVGDGPLYEECKERICKYKLNSIIDMVGFQKNPFPYIKASKIGIMPSLYEGFGLTAIESIILGKPVLNSGVGGLKEIFKDDEELVCNYEEEYIDKFFSSPKIENLDKMLRYTNVNAWKNEILKIYER